MNQIDKYIATLEGTKQEWVLGLVCFMRDVYPDIADKRGYEAFIEY